MAENRKQDLADLEHCVLCGSSTRYRRDLPIDQRQDYVDGAGQLCRECYCSLYRKGRGCCG